MNSERRKNTSFLDLFVALLSVAFISLRVSDVIDWSWWWVLAPLWVYFSLTLIILFASALSKLGKDD